jgi:cytochrome c biogenesis protein CcdA
VSSVSNAGGQSSRRPVAIVLAIIGALFIILGIVYLAVPAGNLPSILGHTHPANGHHVVRMAASFIIGVALLVAAYFVNKGGKSSAGAGASTPAGAATRD